MSETSKRLFVVEDDADYRSTLIEFLVREGHVVLAQAGNLEEAMEAIIQMLGLEEGPEVVLIGDLKSLKKAEAISAEFTEKFPKGKVMSISFYERGWPLEVSRTEEGSETIAEKVSEI